jgi:hypothetical protein
LCGELNTYKKKVRDARVKPVVSVRNRMCKITPHSNADSIFKMKKFQDTRRDRHLYYFLRANSV